MKTSIRFKLRDIFSVGLMTVPFLLYTVLTVLTKPAAEGVSVTGAQIYYTVPFPLQKLYITEAQVTSLCVILAILGLCLFLTNGLAEHAVLKRQHIAELLVEKATSFTVESMGPCFRDFAPFIAAIMGISAFSSLSALLGLFPATSDLNIVAGWAILVFILITHYKLKAGPLGYLKSFTEPIPAFAPFNVISEVATPVSMAFRHYGNVLSGVVISTLLAAGLGGASRLLLSFLPGFLSDIPLLRVGIPAVLSLYFDLFSSCLQAFIFALLTMLYISNACPAGVCEERHGKRRKEKKMQI